MKEEDERISKVPCPLCGKPTRIETIYSSDPNPSIPPLLDRLRCPKCNIGSWNGIEWWRKGDKEPFLVLKRDKKNSRVSTRKEG
jgi:hypothetical protein